MWSICEETDSYIPMSKNIEKMDFEQKFPNFIGNLHVNFNVIGISLRSSTGLFKNSQLRG